MHHFLVTSSKDADTGLQLFFLTNQHLGDSPKCWLSLCWTTRGLFVIIKSILGLIKQRLISVCAYLWSLSPGGVRLWELSQSDLIAISCFKRDSGSSRHPAPSLHYTPKAHLFHFHRQSICFSKTLFCQELLAAWPTGQVLRAIINLVCFVFLCLCAISGIECPVDSLFHRHNQWCK